MSLSRKTVREIRTRLKIRLESGRRAAWTNTDSINVIYLRRKGFTIRDIADVMRCSTKKVQEVLKGDHDGR